MVEYNFSDKSSVKTLLEMHVKILKILRQREIIRSTNNPTGDLAEYLFSKAFGWELADNSTKGFDALDDEGTRFQIKGRRIHSLGKSRRLGAMRELEEKPFDQLAAIIFDEDYSIIQAALFPWEYVLDKSSEIKRSNSYRFVFHAKYMNDSAVEDVTEKIRGVLLT